MIVKKNSVIVWVGPEIKNVNLPQMKTKNVCFYRKCIFGSLTIEIGDYVLISDADAAEPDTIEGCDVAKVLHMYEIDSPFEEDRFRAIVQWYSRPIKIPHKALDRDDIAVDFDLEVIEDHRAYESNVSIETIHDKCVVFCSDFKTIPSYVVQNNKRKRMFPMFVCRYKLIRKDRFYKLVPIGDSNANGADEKTENTPGNRKRSSNSKTPKSSRKRKSTVKSPGAQDQFPEFNFVDVNNLSDEEQLTVSPIKIVNNSVVKTRKNNDEINANYLLESPKVNTKDDFVTKTRNSARRNLNISLSKESNTTADSDILNYSIVVPTPDKDVRNEMKIKLKLSANQPKTQDKTVPQRRRSLRLSTETNQMDTLLHSRQSFDKIIPPVENTPKKEFVETTLETNTPRSRASHTPRRSILKTPNTRQNLAGTPRRSIILSNIVEEVVYKEDEAITTPSKRKSPNAKKNNIDELYEPQTPKRRKSFTTPSQKVTPSQQLKLLRSGNITPSIDNRLSSRNRTKSDLQLTRERLHVSAVPESLPCREVEFKNIFTFVEGKLQDQCGGCMYISGVPGTGKTATVTEVIRSLKIAAGNENIPEFEFIEINGMRLTEPRQAYVQIYKQLTGKTLSWEHAHSLLEKRFMTPSPRRIMTVLLVDELDILCNRRQDVVYNLLDWPAKSAARLVVITIANTMDLPERLLMGKVTSRLGLTRLTFQPYSHKQLQEIVTARLADSESFKCDAVQLVARKVAAVSGDARRALDICRRATEIAEEASKECGSKGFVTMIHVQQALSEMIASAKVRAIKNCSKLEQIFLQAVLAEVMRTGIEETTFLNVYSQLESITAFMGINSPVPGQALRLCAKLGAYRLLICEHSRTDIFQKILLNVSTDDIHYALQTKIN